MKRKNVVVVIVLIIVFAGLAVAGMAIIKGKGGNVGAVGMENSAVEATAEPTMTPTAEPAQEPTPEPTQESAPEVTAAPSEPTEEPTPEPAAEPTAEPTTAPTEAPTQEPTAAPTAEPTQAPTMAPTEVPTAEPTAVPTEEPTPELTEEPRPEPTEEPTPEPTEEPTPEPTEEPTPEPTEEPTPEPTEEPTPEPHVHNYTTQTEEASCEVAGRTYEVCDCGDVRNETVIPALGHDQKRAYYHKATCTNYGYYTLYCARCEAYLGDGTDPKLPHEWDMGTIIHEGSCVEDRLVRYKCWVCGAPKEEYIPQPDAHEWEERTYQDWSEELLTVVTKTVIKCKWCNKVLE